MAVPKLRFKEFNGEWIYFKFSDEIKLMGGATPSKSNKTYWNGDIVWLSSQEIKKKYVEEGTYKITQKAIDDNTTKMVTAGTPLIVSRSGILTRMFPISMPTIDVAINQDIKALIFDKARLDTDFLVGQLQSKESFILKSIVKTGTTVQSVNIPDLQKMKLSLPMNFEEQQKIGVFFKRIDEKIHLQQEKIDLLKKQKKGYMQKIFSQELRFKDDHEKKFPIWETNKLSYYLFEHKVRNYEKIYSKQDVLSVSGEYGIVNQIEFQGRSFAGESVANYHVVHNDDIVYTKSPLKSNPYGIIKCNKGEMGIVSTLYAVYSCKENILGEFLDYYFQLDDHTNSYLRPLVNKGAKNDMKINNENVLKGEITVPLIKEQKKIIQVLSTLDKKINLEQAKYEELVQQKKYFMQQMFI